MLIETKKDLQEHLIDMIDYARCNGSAIVNGPNEELTEDEVYELGVLSGMGEACEALYLACFGGQAYGELLKMLAEKRNEE